MTSARAPRSRTPIAARAPRFACIVLLMLGAACACACGGASVRPAPAAPPARRPLGPLASLVPDGATLVVAACPAALFDSGAGLRIVDALVLPGGLDRFATRTGVDLRRLTEAVYAEYPDGASLVLVRGPIDAPLVVAEAGERMSVVESRADAPFVRRAGLFSDRRRELVALDHDVVVVTGGPAVGPLAALLACVASAHPRCRSAFGGSDADALLAAHHAAALALYAPTGLTLPEGFGAASLLAGTRALAAIVAPRSTEIDLDLDLRGRFPSGAEENFRRLAASLGASSLGAMMGLRSASERVAMRSDPTRLQLHTTLEVGPLVHGLQVLFSGEISEIIELPAVSRDSAVSPSASEVGATIENHK